MKGTKKEPYEIRIPKSALKESVKNCSFHTALGCLRLSSAPWLGLSIKFSVRFAYKYRRNLVLFLRKCTLYVAILPHFLHFALIWPLESS